MTKQEMERTVANLLLEQRRLKRLDLELPPDKLLLLQRLLYRLGYTKMQRKPKRYSLEPAKSLQTWHTHSMSGKPQWFVNHYIPQGSLNRYRWYNHGQPESFNSLEELKEKYPNAYHEDDRNGPIYGDDLSPEQLWAFGLPGGKAPTYNETQDERPDHMIPEDFYTMSRRRSSLFRYMRLTLSKPRPGVSFGGESINEHDMLDENNNVVGNIKLRDRGPILHIDWIGGKGQYAGANTLGKEAIRSVHDVLAANYPRAEYLRGHRISGFRTKEAAVGSPVLIPIRRRNRLSRRRHYLQLMKRLIK